MKSYIMNPAYEFEVQQSFMRYCMEKMYGGIVMGSDIEDEYKDKEVDNL